MQGMDGDGLCLSKGKGRVDKRGGARSASRVNADMRILQKGEYRQYAVNGGTMGQQMVFGIITDIESACRGAQREKLGLYILR